MMEGKRRSLATNSFFSVIAWLFPILLGFISTPILVRSLGNERYGIFALVLGFISYSFTFGVGKVAGKYVPEYQAAGFPEKVTQVIAATFWFSLAIGAAGSLLLVIAAPAIVDDLLLVGAEDRRAAINSLYLAGAIGLIVMLSQVFQFVLQGLHRFDNYVALTNLSGLMLGIGNIVLAVTGFGVPALLTWNLAVTIFTGLLFYIRAKYLLPSIKLLVRVPREVTASVSRYAGSIILYQIFANLLYIFERSWVVRKFGAEGLTQYFVPMLLAIYMHGFLFSVTQAAFPVVNELLNDRERVAGLYRRANKLVIAVVVFVVTNFAVCGALFLELWVGADLSRASYPLLIPHGLTFGVIATAIMSFQLAEAFKFPSLNVIMTGLWMAIAVPLMIATADTWQNEGIAWSRFIAAVIVTIPVVVYAEHRALGKIQWRFWAAVGIRAGIAAAAMGFVERFLLGVMSHTYVGLIVGGLAGTLIFAIVLGVTGFLTPEDRETIRRLISRRKTGVIE